MTARAISPEAIDESFVPVRGDGILALDAGDETVLYHQESGGLHRLNPTGALIWHCCDGSTSLSVLIDELSEAYRAERPSMAAQVVDIVRSLGRMNLLRGVTGQGPTAATTLGRAPGPSPAVPPST